MIKNMKNQTWLIQKPPLVCPIMILSIGKFNIGIEFDFGGFAPQASRTFKYGGIVGYGIVVFITVEDSVMDVVDSTIVVVVFWSHGFVLFPYLQKLLIIFIKASPGPARPKSLRPKILKPSVNFPKAIASSTTCINAFIIFWFGGELLKSPITPKPIVLSLYPLVCAPMISQPLPSKTKPILMFYKLISN